MLRLLSIVLLSFIAFGCATQPAEPPDAAVGMLEAGEEVALRVPARLMHGHDMMEPDYEAPEGYRPIPTFLGELLLTDRRLLFVEKRPAGAEPGWLSIPYADVARARPSATPLLHYLVVWNTAGHANSFLVDRRHVAALHEQFAQMMAKRAAQRARPRETVTRSI